MATPKRIRRPMPMGGVRSSWPSDDLGGQFSPRALNVRFRFGTVRPTPGRGLFDRQPSVESALWLGQFPLSTTVNWPMMLTETKLFRRGDGAPNTPPIWKQVNGTFTPSGTRRWGVTTGEDHLFFSRGTDEIAVWDGDIVNPFTKLSLVAGFEGIGGTANAFACRTMDYFNNRLVCGSTLELGNTLGNRVRWSQNGDFRKWDETLQLGAGFLDLFSEGAEEIKAIRALASQGVVYRLNSITHLVPTGNLDQVFQEDVRCRGLGVLAPYTVASNGQFHMFVGTDGNVWRWDGIQEVPIGDSIYEELKALINVDSLEKYYGFFATQRQEYWLIICDPARGSFDIFVYDYLRNNWSRDSFPNLQSAAELIITTQVLTWNTVQGTWATFGNRSWNDLRGTQFINLIGGRTDGATMLIDEQFSYDYYAQGSIIDKFIETDDQYLIDDDPANEVTAVRLLLVYEYMNNTNPIQVGVSFDRGSTWTEKTLIPEPKGYTWVEFEKTGNVIRYRFRENDANGSFRWRSYVQEYQYNGPFIGTAT